MFPVHVKPESLSHRRKRGNKVETNPCTNRFLEKKDMNGKQKADETTFYMDQVWDTTPNGKNRDKIPHTGEIFRPTGKYMKEPKKREFK